MSSETVLCPQPVFVVGSPRSGTSILSWCLGQHPNLLSLEESNWMAPCAVDLAVAFRRGSARGERSQLFSMGVERDQFIQNFGVCINEFIVKQRQAFEERLIRLGDPERAKKNIAFRLSRDELDPKLRWVDGTPEYSRGIPALRKLFPSARFIHLLRHCDPVVLSMLNFERVAGTKLIDSEQEGYQYWLACVRACLIAESACGPGTVYRIFYEDLVENSERTIRRILEFLGEPFDPACLEPLAQRINSSNVTADEIRPDPPADPTLVAEAHEQWHSLKTNPQPETAMAAAAALMEQQFEERVNYVDSLDAQYAQAQKVHAELQQEFKERTEWALSLNQQVEEKNKVIFALRQKLEEQANHIVSLDAQYAQAQKVHAQLQQEFEERTEWALSLNQQVEEKNKVIFALRQKLEEKTEAPGP